MSPAYCAADRRAIIFLVGAGCGFGLSDTLTKLTSFSLPLSEVILVRGLTTSICLVIAVALAGNLTSLKRVVAPRMLGRGLLEMTATISYIAALPHVHLAELSTVAMSSPIFLILFAIIFYREPVGWHRWMTIVWAVLGVVCISRPSPVQFNAWVLMGALCALVSAARDLVTRRIDSTMPSLTVALPGSVLITFFGLVSGFGEIWPIPSAIQFASLFLAGVGHGAGLYLTVLSFRGNVTLSLVSPFRYFSVVWTGLGGFLVFAERPDGWSVVGAALIVGAGLYALHREIVRNRPLSALASSEN